MRVFWGAVLLLLWIPVGLAAQNGQGAEQIQLHGGTRGEVFFPHLRHQNALKDCMACHKSFPQEPGAIARLKAEGKLAGRQIMNQLCIECHRSEKSAGKAAGPIACSACHSGKGP